MKNLNIPNTFLNTREKTKNYDFVFEGKTRSTTLAHFLREKNDYFLTGHCAAQI